jgi:[ribosomal protein S18]-alanine N-acetyltransferase
MKNFFFSLFSKTPPAILEARPRDADALAKLHSRSFPVGWSESEMEQLLSDHSVIAHVARADGGRGSIRGFIMSRIAADEAEILSVAVDPSTRGRGLAGDLLRHHLSRVAARGISKIFLEVGEDNRPAIRLYHKAGFLEVGKRAGYYQRSGSAISALVLRRELA